MPSRNLVLGFLSFLLWLFFPGCNGAPTRTSADGSGTEDGNSLTGILFEAGAPAWAARVTAVPAYYNPALDSGTAVSVQADTAGRFIFANLRPGHYNIEAVSASGGTRSLRTDVYVSAGPVHLSAETLAAPGALSIPVHAKMRAGGYFYINGTTRLHRLTGGELLGGTIRFDSVFAGQIPALFYALAGDTQNQSALADSLLVSAGGNALLDTPFVARAHRLSAPPVIDGALDEYAHLPPLRVIKRNGSALYRLAYDDSALYAGISVSDRFLNAQIILEDGDVWLDDCVGIFLDINRNGGALSDTADFKFWVSAAGIKRDVKGMVGPAWNARFQYAVTLQGTLNQNADIDTGYTVEMRIPWAEIGIASPGNISRIGFDAVMFDNDGEVWSPAGAWANTTGGNLNDPDGWGELVIIP